MIDIVEYFDKTIENNDYYFYKFKDLQFGCLEYDKITFFDDDEIIKRFKDLAMPRSSYTKKEEDEFIYICNYLNDNKYYIEQFPNFLERPSNVDDFSYNIIRTYIISIEGYNDGGVTWQTRRNYVNALKLVKKQEYQINEDLETIFSIVSTRNAKFNNMVNDEKLEAICNSIEYILKENGKYIELDYSDSLGYLSNQKVRDFRNLLECFRHDKKEDIEQRNKFNNLQKEFLISYGLVVIDFINKKKNEIDKQ